MRALLPVQFRSLEVANNDVNEIVLVDANAGVS